MIRQRLVAGADNKTQVLLVGVLPKKDGAVVRLTLPLGIAVTKTVRTDVDDAVLAETPIRTCLSTGCVSVAPVDAAQVARLKAGKTLQVTFGGLDGRNFKVSASLAGFTKAFDQALSGKAKEAN